MRALLLGISIALAAPVIASAADLSGGWKFVATGPKGGTNEMPCKLVQTGEKITGTCTTKAREVDVTGSVNGAQVEFGWAVGGGAVRIDLKGDVEPDGMMKGTMSIAGTDPTVSSVNLTFVGTRQ